MSNNEDGAPKPVGQTEVVHDEDGVSCDETDNPERCGYISIVGRPNVGKSTLLNHLVQQKISITSRKPQTTRHNVRAMKTVNNTQMIFVDTPGIHKPKNTAINRYMNRVAASAVLDVDVIIFVVDRDVWTDEDEIVLQRLKNADAPVILVVNKVDRLNDKTKLIPHIERVSEFLEYAEIVPSSALHGHNLDVLEEHICKRLPIGMHFYPEDQVTDRSCRFMAAELVREKITRQLGEELPYQIAVEIESF